MPLAKAYYAGYYDEMVDLIRVFFGQALKTNDSLFLAVLTSCLRISKESIFTGLNNFKIYTMKENFYHGILLGLFAGMSDWKARSNADDIYEYLEYLRENRLSMAFKKGW